MMGMVTIEESDDEKSIVTPNARLVFVRDGERWRHRIECGTAEGRRIFAETIEAEPGRDDFRSIASPTFQDLHVHEDGPRLIAMLVGQFGPRHFSATMTVSWLPADAVPRSSAKTTIVVDVADRSRDPARCLASTYRMDSDVGAPTEADEHRACWDLPAPGPGEACVSLMIGRGESKGGRLAIDASGPRSTTVQLNRELLASQSSGRLEYVWSVENA